MSALRKAVPIPNATMSARSDSGRAISGRIGISFASTVSSVMEVPPTHSSGVAPSCPAWTEAISSSRTRTGSSPASIDARLVGLDDEARAQGRREDDDQDCRDTADARSHVRRGRDQRASPTPSAAFVRARTTMMAGDPMSA